MIWREILKNKNSLPQKPPPIPPTSPDNHANLRKEQRVGGIGGRNRDRKQANNTNLKKFFSIDNCWLDDQGRLRIRGLPPQDISRLDLLVQLGASVKEIENHIHPIGTPHLWVEWLKMKKGYQINTNLPLNITT